MPLIDSHCHLDFPCFDQDRKAIIEQCQQLGINQFIIPAINRQSWLSLLTLCDRYACCWPALGLHPCFIQQHTDDDVKQLRQILLQHPAIAIGEIGLDFYDKTTDKQAQITRFEQQLAMAEEFALPVILHVRKAHHEVIARLRKYHIHHGIVHAFSSSQQQAEQYIEQGLLLGVGSLISYPNAQRLRQLFQQLPLQHLVLESDAPDMSLFNAPALRNTPLSIYTTCQQLAQLRTETPATIATITSQNVTNLFRLPS